MQSNTHEDHYYNSDTGEDNDDAIIFSFLY
jgi:hypothetical protein